MTRTQTISLLIKPLVFTAALVPFAFLVYWTAVQAWGPNPALSLHRYTGDWAIRFLLLSLAITPLRLVTGVNDFARFRRMIGLFAYFYGMLHLVNYVGLDKYFDWHDIWLDILKRNFITVGVIALTLMTALAVTSPHAMVRKLGGKRWQALHRMNYVIGVLACVHFIMMVRGFQWEPWIYSAILAVLLGYRLARRLNHRPQWKTDQRKTDQRKTDQRKTDQRKTDQRKTDQRKTDQRKTDQLKNMGAAKNV